MENNDYTVFKGKKVTVTTKGEDIDGTVEEASLAGIVLKPKNSSRSLLVESKDIDDIVESGSGPKRLKSKSLPQPVSGKFREHLVDRHGYPLADIQAMAESDAESFHNSLDHSPLGHFHRAVTPAEEAIAEAETEV